jgi:predicted ferric reductase
MGVLAAAAMVIHAVVLGIARPAYLGGLDPTRFELGPLAGIVSLLAVSALIVLTVLRKQIGLGYETWRLTHVILSVLALVAAQVHVSVTGLYAAVPGKHVALLSFSAACVALVVYLRLVMPARLRLRPYAVTEVRPEGGSTWTVALAPVGHAGLEFAPGQFAWLRLGCSPWSVVEHPFSFSSSAENRGRIDFAIKEQGDFTRAIGSTAIGTRAYVDGPHGSFSIDFHGSPAGFLFVAGGIGIAPIMSMIRTLSDRRDQREHVVVYACSSWERVSFRDQLEDLTRTMKLKLVIVLSNPPTGWAGASGFITKHHLEGVVFADGVPRAAFVCGPDAMMDSVEKSLLACGLTRRLIHMERFNLA